MASPSDRVARSPGATLGYAWGVVLLGAWLFVGIDIVSRALNLGLVEDASFSPYHVPGYAGLIALAAFVLVQIARAGRRHRPWQSAFPPHYAGLALGLAAAAAWIIVDILWRNTFGIQPGIEGRLSPSRLLLPVAVGMVASGPLLDALDLRWAPASTEVRLRRLAGVGSVALIGAAAAAFVGFHPVGDVWAQQATTGGDRSEIWLMAADGSHQTRLLPASGNGVDYSLPVWSPDGSRIAFTRWSNLGDTSSNREPEAQTTSIWTMSADGTDVRPLVDAADAWAWIPQWSPDGTWILYSVSPTSPTAPDLGQPQPGPPLGQPAPLSAPGTASRSNLWLVHPDGTGRQQLTANGGDNVAGAWAPDGRTIAFVSTRDGASDVYIATLRDGRLTDERQLTPTDDRDDGNPVWSPDGTRIALVSDEPGRSHIWVVNADGGGLRKLTDSSANEWVPAWSPDGARIAYTSDASGEPEVWTMAADGSDAHNLTSETARADGQWSVSWSPDGRRLVYASAPYPPAEASSLVRDDLAAAGMLLQALLLALVAVLLVRIRAPFGSLTAVLLIEVILAAAFVSDQWRFLPGLVLAGLAADALVRASPAAWRSRVAAAALPVALVLAVGITLVVQGQLGWSVTLFSGVALGSILMGWAVAEIVERIAPEPVRATPAG